MLSNNYNIYLAHLFRLFSGMATGTLFIIGYVIVIGANHHLAIDGYAFRFIALAFCFSIEYRLEVLSGYQADRFGEKLTLTGSFVTKLLFFLCITLSIGINESSPILFLGLIFFAYIFFALSASLFCGNYEEWLQKQCDDTNSLKVFSTNTALFNIGLIFGSMVIFLSPVSGDYMALLSEVAPIFSFACFFMLLSVVLVFLFRNGIDFNFSNVKQLCASYFFVNKELDQTRKQDIQNAYVELAEKPFLNQLFWVNAGRFGIEVTLKTLAPIFIFESSAFNLTEKFILIITCMILPNAIGSILKRRKQNDPNRDDLRLMANESYLFYAITIIVCGLAFLPFNESNVAWYVDPYFISFAVTLILLQIVTGRVNPHFATYTSQYARENSDWPKTVLSIGEKRKKIGMIVTLLLSTLASFFPLKEAYFLIIAFFAAFCLLHTVFVFGNGKKNRDLENPVESK